MFNQIKKNLYGLDIHLFKTRIALHQTTEILVHNGCKVNLTDFLLKINEYDKFVVDQEYYPSCTNLHYNLTITSILIKFHIYL